MLHTCKMTLKGLQYERLLTRENRQCQVQQSGRKRPRWCNFYKIKSSLGNDKSFGSYQWYTILHRFLFGWNWFENNYAFFVSPVENSLSYSWHRHCTAFTQRQSNQTSLYRQWSSPDTVASGAWWFQEQLQKQGVNYACPPDPNYGQCCSNTRLIKATHTRTIDHFVRYLCTLWCTGALWYAWTLWYARTLWYAWTRMAASDTQLIATLSPAAWPNEKQTLPNLWLLFAANAGSCFSWSRSVEAVHGLRALFGDAW